MDWSPHSKCLRVPISVYTQRQSHTWVGSVIAVRHGQQYRKAFVSNKACVSHEATEKTTRLHASARREHSRERHRAQNIEHDIEHHGGDNREDKWEHISFYVSSSISVVRLLGYRAQRG